MNQTVKIFSRQKKKNKNFECKHQYPFCYAGRKLSQSVRKQDHIWPIGNQLLDASVSLEAKGQNKSMLVKQLLAEKHIPNLW